MKSVFEQLHRQGHVVRLVVMGQLLKAEGFSLQRNARGD
jgi:hypothetical protein